VLLGTLYPLIIDALHLGKLSVGPPYFNSVFVPVMLPLLVLLAVGPLARWKQADARDMARRLRVAAVLAIAAGLVLPLLAGGWTPGVALALLLSVWIAAGTLCQVQERLKSGWPPRSFWGMHVAHLGVAVFVAGVGMVKGYEVEKDVRMAVGDTVSIGGYEVEFLGVREVAGPNYTARQGAFALSKDGRQLRELRPEKRHYPASQSTMTEAAIDTGFTHDLYVSLGEPLASKGNTPDWSVRVYFKPFVTWIWFGCLLMALGGGIAAADRRYRLKSRRTAPAAEGAPA